MSDQQFLNVAAAAEITGLSRDAIYSRARRNPSLRRRVDGGWSYDVEGLLAGVVGDHPSVQASQDTMLNRLRQAGIEPPPLKEQEPIERLLERRQEAWYRKDATHTSEPIRVERDRPFAICHFGDPHLDDDGCNWPLLLKTVNVVQQCDGMFAGNIGDNANHWIGRLKSLYAHQSSTEDEASRLVRWFLNSMEWDYLQLGNHDLWSHELYTFLAEECQILAVGNHDVKIDYEGGIEPFKLWARHNFPGHSMYATTHGPHKASMFRPEADLYVCGHLHTWGEHRQESYDARAPLALRLRGFKWHDDYAAKLGHREDQMGASVTTVIDPQCENQHDRISVFHDTERAADYLEFLRKR